MKYLKLTFILCFSLFIAKAQVTTNSRRVADVYFVNKEYYAAAEYYKKSLRISADSAGFVVPYGFESKMQDENAKKMDYEYLVFQLASSLRLYKNFRDAEQWFAIASNFTNPRYELSNYWYGECLHANLKYEQAIVAYTNFMTKHKSNDNYRETARKEIESCKFALAEIKRPRMFKLSRLASDVNYLGSNYAPTLNSQVFYFTSSRPIGNGGKKELLESRDKNTRVVKKETPFVNTLYTVNNADPKATDADVKKLDLDLKDMEVAAPTIHPNGEWMFFTAWINKEGQKRSIYYSRKIDQKWSNPLPLAGEINVNGFNAMQPFVTKDGKYLIFSSDRPGGVGKYDLWYAVLRADGTTGNAMNMGTTINSAGDDEAPYYNYKTQKLLFSTNGRVGLGGFDFFESEGNFSSWNSPINMGYPFNSAKDDLYFTPLDELDETGYISSDRESVCCLEIFQIKREYLNIGGKLIDCATSKPMAGAKITLTGSDFVEQNLVTDVNGNYNFKVSSNRGFKVSAYKADYFAKSINYTYDQLATVDTLISPNLCLTTYKINKPIVLKNIFYEFDSDVLTDASKKTLDELYDLMIDNTNLEIELGAHTDNIGTEAYNLDLSNRRAKSCVDYLVSKGIAPNKVTSQGYGFSIPVAPNKFRNGKDNAAGRALNRRTEFKVTKK